MMNVATIFLLAFSIFATVHSQEMLARWRFPGEPWELPPSLAGLPSIEIDSKEHGVTDGVRGTTCECGKANRDNDGSPKYLFLAGIADDIGQPPFCGAVIISKIALLTSAYCINDATARKVNPVVVTMQYYDPNDKHNAYIKIKKTITHRFSKESFVNDIALLIIEQPLVFGEFAAPVCTARRKLQLDGRIVRIIGWGEKNFKEPNPSKSSEVDLRVIDTDTCRGAWPDINPNQICGFSIKEATCQGDAGGPVVWLDPETNRYTLVGLVSYGPNCTVSKPSVETGVTAYTQWIMRNIPKEYNVPGISLCHKE